jgi:hypothetical protein
MPKKPERENYRSQSRKLKSHREVDREKYTLPISFKSHGGQLCQFHHCDKTHEINNLRRDLFWLSYTGFSL